MRFRYAGRDGPDADFGNQLDRNPRLGIDILQIVDELGQVLDRVNVVVRRRRNQADAGNRVAHARDDLVHFVPGKLASLARLGALRDLDLQIVGIDQIVRRNAEASRGDLLDGAAPPVAVWVAFEAFLVLAAFAGIRAPAD